MSTITKLILILAIHLIGGLITLLRDCKNGTMEYAAKYGDGIYSATPSDVVYDAFVLWEFELFFYLVFILPAELINEYFRSKYNGGDTNAK